MREAVLQGAVHGVEGCALQLPVLRNALDGTRSAKGLVADVGECHVACVVPCCDAVDDGVYVKHLQQRGMRSAMAPRNAQVEGIHAMLRCLRVLACLGGSLLECRPIE